MTAPLRWYDTSLEVIAAVESMRPSSWTGNEHTEVQLVRYIAPSIVAESVPGLRFSTFSNGREYGAVYATGEHLFTVFKHRTSGELLFSGRRIDDAIADGDEESAIWPYLPYITDRGRVGIGGWTKPDFEAFALLISDLLWAATEAAPGTATESLLDDVFGPVLEDEDWWDR